MLCRNFQDAQYSTQRLKFHSLNNQPVQVDCYPAIAAAKTGGTANNVVSLLNDLHFLALHNLADIQLGSDLLFWFHYTQALKRIVFKDQYIPALKYRDLERSQTASQRKSAQAAPMFRFASGQTRNFLTLPLRWCKPVEASTN